MRNKHLLSVCLAAVITATCTVGFSGSTLRQNLDAVAVDTNNDDWLHASGSRLYDKDGNEVWLTGANWFGLNCTENAPHGLYAAEADPFLKAVADHGINVIRFPISTELVVSWMNGTPNKVSSVQAWASAETGVGFNVDFLEEDGKTVKNSLEIFDMLIEKFKKYGLKCFIDIHSPHSDNSGHDYNLWYGKETATAGMITTDLWIESLVWLADYYSNDDTVLGYDLKNEPHGKGQEGDEAAKWDDSTDENNWQYASTKCANAILKVNPNALIFIEGVEQSMSGAMAGDYWGMPDRRDNSPYTGAWWGGNLRGVKDNPVVPDSGTSQIVYSPHDYGPSVYDQTWFAKDFTEQTLLDDYWYDTWAYINDQDIAPLLIGEWGGHMDDGKNQKWMCLLRDYMIKNHINHTFWCLNPNSGDTGGLLGSDFTTWDDNKYNLMEESLWQTQKSGKYIGLDHQMPLGDNGLSLTEFYEKYANTEGSNLDGGTIGGNKGTPSDIVTKPNEPSETTTAASAQTTAGGETTTTGARQLKWGDADCSNLVDVSDAVLICRYGAEDKAAVITSAGQAQSDVSGNGKIDAEDALKILRYIAGFITEAELAP